MKFKNYYEYKISLIDYIDAAFDELPVNSFIHKGRCGVGGTTKELLNFFRNTILIVPQKGIIECKQDEHDFILPVHGDVTVPDVISYLEKDLPFKKIMSTPDSFWKIIAAAKQSNTFGGTANLYKTFFLLVDECHSIVTEAWRAKITEPFRYFWEFDNKSLISAPPFEFSDPLMQTLDYHRITFEEEFLGKVHICHAPYIDGYINYILTNCHVVPGNVHIFFNSVIEIAEAINQAKLMDCNIYCADKKSNMDTLGELKQYYQHKPIKGQFKKYNFYTSKYFEGVDIEDKNATVILVTDVRKPHTKVGITNKGVQAIGRVRTSKDSSINQIIHVTNHRNINSMKTIEEFKREYDFHADDAIESHNNYVEKCIDQGFKPSEDRIKIVEKFAFIDDETQKASRSPIKIDQHVNEAACNEEFNHIDFIEKAWEKAGFETQKGRFLVKLEKVDQPNKRKKKKEMTKYIFQKIHDVHLNKDEYLFCIGEHPLTQVQKEHPEEFEAYTKLGMDKLEELSFNYTDELIKLKEVDAETKLLMLLGNAFQIGDRFTKKYGKEKLQAFYDMVGITTRKATAEQLGEKGRFDIEECKIKEGDKYVNGFRIIRAHFSLKMAA